MSNRDVTQVRDSRVLAAASHPLRRRLMDVLKVEGPATASILAARTEQAVANVSHHLKVLAGAGLIVEVPERARDKRERWWTLASAALRWSESDFADDPVGQAVASAAASINLDRQVGLVRAWHAAPEEQRAVWDDSAFSTDKWLSMTPDELAAFERELQGLVDRWAARTIPDDGNERATVFFFAHGVPAKP
ncbi:helix-turn-helix domain-containing protein [Dactylosporangium sp. NBC_01737]|uniref:ArsR/SmtB family transcription factor n=1 Tax=Dactylosporangium sp. NBC_01737 TaxID=2975959 RepID=UPI002E122133|nr:helix-turn-helix domain-containing protein [Dactylosporangium sp. NBC_01737]